MQHLNACKLTFLPYLTMSVRYECSRCHGNIPSSLGRIWTLVHHQHKGHIVHCTLTTLTASYVSAHCGNLTNNK